MGQHSMVDTEVESLTVVQFATSVRDSLNLGGDFSTEIDREFRRALYEIEGRHDWRYMRSTYWLIYSTQERGSPSIPNFPWPKPYNLKRTESIFLDFTLDKIFSLTPGPATYVTEFGSRHLPTQQGNKVFSLDQDNMRGLVSDRDGYTVDTAVVRFHIRPKAELPYRDIIGEARNFYWENDYLVPNWDTEQHMDDNGIDLNKEALFSFVGYFRTETPFPTSGRTPFLKTLEIPLFHKTMMRMGPIVRDPEIDAIHRPLYEETVTDAITQDAEQDNEMDLFEIEYEGG